jgi:hypothetical protein
MSLPRVRISKDGEWLLCTSVPCGVRLAYRAVEVKRYTRGITVWFGSGWTVNDGTWQMSRRAWERLSQGKAPAFRRAPYRSEKKGSDRLASGGFTLGGHAARELRPDNWRSVLPTGLPALIVCPRCGVKQVADADVLTFRQT